MANKEQSAKTAEFLGKIVSFSQSLTLIHWSVTGKGSYETHISLDQAIDTLTGVTDRLVETSFALLGTLDIVIPETHRPKVYIPYIEDFYQYVETNRSVFKESFSQSIVDDFQEAVIQLLFRLKRLE